MKKKFNYMGLKNRDMLKKLCMLVVLSFFLNLVSTQKVKAQAEVLEVIKAGVKKVIKAVDLKIQRMQNKTLWLQNAQKILENELSGLKLAEIGQWVERQRSLYSEYYQELWNIKSAITSYHRLKEVVEKQALIHQEYRTAMRHVKSTDVFNTEEVRFMGQVYNGILKESVSNADNLLGLIKAFSSQMEDAERMKLIDETAQNVTANLTDLRLFNEKVKQLYLMRAKERNNISELKEWFGL